MPSHSSEESKYTHKHVNYMHMDIQLCQENRIKFRTSLTIRLFSERKENRVVSSTQLAID